MFLHREHRKDSSKGRRNDCDVFGAIRSLRVLLEDLISSSLTHDTAENRFGPIAWCDDEGNSLSTCFEDMLRDVNRMENRLNALVYPCIPGPM